MEHILKAVNEAIVASETTIEYHIGQISQLTAHHRGIIDIETEKMIALQIELEELSERYSLPRVVASKEVIPSDQKIKPVSKTTSGKKQPHRLTQSDVDIIKKSPEKKAVEIAKFLNISPSCVSDVRLGKHCLVRHEKLVN